MHTNQRLATKKVDPDYPILGPIRAQRKRELAPVIHVVMALGVGGLSLLFAVMVLLPGGPADRMARPLVFAADTGSTRNAIETSSPGQDQPLRSPALLASTDAQTPPLLLAEVATELAVLHCDAVNESWNPIATAEIWIDDGEWHLAGRSNNHGHFELRFDAQAWERRFALGESVLIGARASNHGPSLVTTLTSIQSRELRLVLRGGGAALKIDVSGANGEPITGAQIRFQGSLAVLVTSDATASPTPTPSATTDNWGTAALSGLEPGFRQFSVQADGFMPAHGEVQLDPKNPQAQNVQLAALSSLKGSVFGAAGFAQRTTVVVLDILGSTRFETQCNENGQFEFQALPAGQIRLIAEARDESGSVVRSAQAEVLLVAYEINEWNLTLQIAPFLGGRLLNSEGQPLGGWLVELRTSDSELALISKTTTENDGSYEAPLSAEVDLATLLFYNPIAFDSLPTFRVKVETRLPETVTTELEEGLEFANSIQGRLLGPDGAPLSSSPLLIQRLEDQSSLVLYADAETGQFESPALPPGKYIMRFPEHGRGWVLDQSYEIDGQELLDVGTIQLPATGTLELLTPEPERRETCVALQVELVSQGIDIDYTLPVLWGLAELPIELELGPGNYRLRMMDEAELRWFMVSVESGQTTHFVVPMSE